MISIDFTNIGYSSANIENIVEQCLSQSLLTEVIDNQAILVINNFPNDNKVLSQFINEVGQPIVDFRSESTIFEVKPVKRNSFFQSFANSNYYFSLHTDCADFEVIPNGLAMLCVTPANQGGESLFIQLDDVIAHLDNDERQMLLDKKWSFRKQKHTILNKDISDNSYKVCYNRIMLESYSELTAEELAFLDKFDNLLIEYSFEYKLQENQLVICNNHTILHGRKAFDESEDRLIKRIRFDFNPIKKLKRP